MFIPILLSIFFMLTLSGYPVKQMPLNFHYDLEYNFYDYCDEVSHKQECYDKYAMLIKNMSDAHHSRGYNFSIDANVFMDNKKVNVSGIEVNMMEYVLGHCDRVVLMDYNKNIPLIKSQAQDEITYYNSVGKKLDIGILVKCPQYIESFCDPSELENALTEVHNYYSGENSYEMMAIHYLKNWKNLNPPPNSGIPRAVWSWGWGESILTDDDVSEEIERAEIIAFMMKNNVKKIYVAAETALIWRPEGLAKFLNDTFDVGIQVELEIGDSSNPSKNKLWLFNHTGAVDFANRMMNVTDKFFLVNDVEGKKYSPYDFCCNEKSEATTTMLIFCCSLVILVFFL